MSAASVQPSLATIHGQGYLITFANPSSDQITLIATNTEGDPLEEANMAIDLPDLQTHERPRVFTTLDDSRGYITWYSSTDNNTRTFSFRSFDVNSTSESEGFNLSTGGTRLQDAYVSESYIWIAAVRGGGISILPIDHEGSIICLDAED